LVSFNHEIIWMSVYINAIGTANPPHKISQKQIQKFMAAAHEMDGKEAHQLEILYRATGIHTRYSVLEDYGQLEAKDYQFYPPNQAIEPFPSVGQRMRVYEKAALPLAQEAVLNTLPEEFDKKYITHLISVSCTGMYAPGIGIELIESLDLSSAIQRTAINFMGCYAAFNAIKTAYHILQSTPDAKVLIVAVELCSLHFQKKKDADNLLANALFGDGAAALLMSNEILPNQVNFSLANFYCDLAFQGKNEMAWAINDYGFEMKLTAMVPEFIRDGIHDLTQKLLQNMDLTIGEIDYFAIHPGGRKILRVIEEALHISSKSNQLAYEVLREYGNMSSPTVLFVLKKLMEQLSEKDHGKSVLSFAFGPGLTLESMLLGVEFGR